MGDQGALWPTAQGAGMRERAGRACEACTVCSQTRREAGREKGTRLLDNDSKPRWCCVSVVSPHAPHDLIIQAQPLSLAPSA